MFATSYTTSYLQKPFGEIYIDEPVFARADLNDDNDFSDTDEHFYYLHNTQYSVHAILDTSGSIIEVYKNYQPYGAVSVYTGDGGDSDWFDGDETTGSLTGNYYLFTGRRYDPEADLMFYRNRMYSTGRGRFLTRDPVGYVDGLNLYRAYFVPLGMDPFGEEWKAKDESSIAAFTQYIATEDGDSLKDLATIITGNEDDWVCIKPTGGSNKWTNYPLAKPCATADPNNLYNMGTTLKMSAPGVELAMSNLFFGVTTTWGNNPASLVKTYSQEGKTPISKMYVSGHCNVNRIKICDKTRSTCFSVADVFDLSQSPSYDRAKNSKFPARCWFTRYAEVHALGCYSNRWARSFAMLSLRNTASAFGLTRILQVSLYNRAYISQWHSTESSALNDSAWVEHKGGCSE